MSAFERTLKYHLVSYRIVLPNSHRPTDTTRQCCLRRIGRCELSLETVWQSVNSQPIDQFLFAAPSSRGVW